MNTPSGFRASTLVALVSAAAIFCAQPAFSQQQDSQSLFPEMQWRMIGPHRGGRVLPALGVPGKPNEYLFGAVGGGVWKTENAGRTWHPIFDAAAHRLHRRNRHRALRPANHLRRQRRSGHALRYLLRRRRLQIHRRRCYLAQHRPARLAPNRQYPGRPARPEHRPGRRARPRLRPESRTRRLSLQRRRRDLDKSSRQR